MNDNSIKSLWNDSEASQYKGDLGLRVYTSRLLGRDPSLVLHGGGNTSVKINEKNLVGEEEEILYVKGSGWDLATIEEAGFSPVRIVHLRKLAKLPALSDPQMANELLTQMTRATAPAPSVEAILHAILPFKFVDHTHADAFIAVSNAADGGRRIREIYGDRVVYIPYVMPGFDLSRLCAELFPAHPPSGLIGMALEHHGLFSFGNTARESYERMIDLVGSAEKYLQLKKAWKISSAKAVPPSKPVRREIAALRKQVSDAAGQPMVLSVSTASEALAFCQRKDASAISLRGPATPDHVIRTKRIPLFGRDVDAYARHYREYFEENAPHARATLTMLDPAPRVILDPELGLCCVGKSSKEARIVEDIYCHTMEIIQRAELLGGWEALPGKDLFDVEYWDLEQAKVRKAGKLPLFSGEVALVTGAASGIGKACVQSLLSRGAAVVGVDINPEVARLFPDPAFHGIACDLTDEAGIAGMLEQAVRTFGGLDMLILNAGIFPKACSISEMATESWRKIISLNLDSNFVLMRECHPLLKLAPKGGRVVVIGSKNVPAPGPGVAAYSASKAAVNQLARVAALEWGQDHIRINSIHPNMVFDTGLWTPEVLEARARHYKLSVEEYKTNNVLRVEVQSRDVAELAAEMCGPLFQKTTGSQVPIDGGNERVI